VSVVDALLLPSVDRDFGARELVARGEAIDSPRRVVVGQSPLKDFLGADEPKGRVPGQPLGVVDILIARQSAVYRTVG
jgi:hypothetical protein